MVVDKNWGRLERTVADICPYEATLMELLYNRFDSGDIFYNVGARWGVFSILASKCGVPPKQIHNFEANENNFELLERNTDSAMCNTQTFISDDNSGDSMSIDTYTDNHKAPTIMKIDVEGAEAKVIRGSARTLKTNRPTLFVEMHPEKIRNMGDDQHDIISTLKSYGYEIEIFIEHRADSSSVPVDNATLPIEGDYLLHAWES